MDVIVVMVVMEAIYKPSVKVVYTAVLEIVVWDVLKSLLDYEGKI